MKALIVDDAPEVRTVVSAIAREFQVDTVHADSLNTAREALEMHMFEMVVLDLKLPDGNGLDLIRQNRGFFAQTGIIVLSGNLDVDTAVRATRMGAHDVIEKKDMMHRLAPSIQALLRRAGTGSSRSVSQPPPSADSNRHRMTGDSPQIQQLYSALSRVAHSNFPILVTGETGSGKELIAREIHRLRTGEGGPFVVLDCTTINPTTFESELFGHVKGSFTGAVADHIGVIREADGGTLFVDEIGELPSDTQAKLLRAIQEREVRPVGSARAVPFTAQLIFATNRDLLAETKSGTFRADLFFRISALTLKVPPLRERGDDIPALFLHFLGEACTNSLNGCESFALAEDARQMLLSHSWPGNVRELQNLAHWVAAFREWRLWSATGTTGEDPHGIWASVRQRCTVN